MSKRLLRLFPPFPLSVLTPLVTHDISVVQRDNRTIFGRLEAVGGDSLLLHDLRSHPHQVQLADVAEIIYDQKSKIFPKIAEPV